MIILSKKGKGYTGKTLTEDNLRGGVLVVYRGGVYVTGNRRHNLVELNNISGDLMHIADMKDIKLISCNSD